MPPMKDDVLLEEILRRLAILISLELESADRLHSVSITEKIERLATLGLSAAEIGRILGKSTNYVTATVSRQAKAAKRQRRNY